MLYDRAPATKVIGEIQERRVDAGKLAAGVAAASNSDMFKGPQHGKPKAKRWDHHISEESRLRQPCALKQAAQFLKKPGLISLGSGLPSSQVFPFAELSMKIPVVPGFSEQATSEAGARATIGKYDIQDGKAEYDLSIALNYGQSTGSAQMMRYLTEHTEIICQPPYADWAICQTIGSTGALEQAMRMFCDKSRRDAVLIEEFGFSTAMETIEPLRVGIFGTSVDSQGIVAEAMDELLSNWDQGTRGFRKPHILYTVPSGSNPTGATQGLERRQAIYAVAQKHDMIIIEDEPYYFLQMDPYGQGESPPPATIDEFVASLVPSYVSIDVDGRVMRLDSFSKVLAPGSRLGWVVASKQLIERYQRHAEVASQGPSGFSQVILHKLLDETWGHEGYLKWLMNLRAEYTQKRNALMVACEKHLPRDIVSWTPPASGMFVWLTVDHTKHPDHGNRKLEDIEQEIFDACIDRGVLVARGSWFRAEQHVPLSGLYFRATFATASPENMDIATSRLGDAVRSSFRNSK
ncbi:hypothetical protein MY11210_002365 [Beauveria gryllotalpidicola]